MAPPSSGRERRRDSIGDSNGLLLRRWSALTALGRLGPICRRPSCACEMAYLSRSWRRVNVGVGTGSSWPFLQGKYHFNAH